MTNEVSKVYVLFRFDGVYDDFVGVYSTIELARQAALSEELDILDYLIREVDMNSSNGLSKVVESKLW